MNRAAREVLCRFGLGTAALEALGNRGGFSGASLWRCRSTIGDFCLRAWPKATPVAQLSLIHGWMRAARERHHLDFVPAVRQAPRDVTLIEHEGLLWDVTSWLPGLADFREHPSRERLEQACMSLAFLHLAWSDFESGRGSCPAVQRRVQACDEWRHLVSTGWQPPRGAYLANRAWQILSQRGSGAAPWLFPWTLAELPLQPCLCDIWHDHILFEEEEVRGIIDYGEAKIDNIAVDLARMLGSLVEDDEEAWAAGLTAYRRVRPLSETEEALVRVLDRTGTILGAANWLRWLYHEERHFEDRAAAERRLAVLVARMERWQDDSPMNTAVLLLLTALVSYLVGSIPFGYLIARMRGVDIFKAGSGNIGATNVGRVLGRKFGLLVFTLDLLKGALPTLAASLLSAHFEPELPPDSLAVVAALMAFLGHLFPVYVGFQGGKGVATGAGAVLVLVPVPALAGFAAWLAAVSASRIVSFASLAAAAVLCVLRLVLTPQPFASENRVLTIFCLWAALLVFVRHHANIRRIIAGNENRLKDRSAMLTLSKVLHLLALGLWFGMSVFFSFVVGFALFGSFEKVAVSDKTAPERMWFPLSPYFEEDVKSDKLPKPLRKEQGTRAAGFAITPLFHWYFLLQAASAVVALLTALGWTLASYSGKVHRIRAIVLLLAMVTVGVGWWLEKKVGELRVERNAALDDLLTNAKPTEEDVKTTEEARASFGSWHGISVIVNLLTIVLVTGALALAAQLPEPRPSPRPEMPEA